MNEIPTASELVHIIDEAHSTAQRFYDLYWKEGGYERKESFILNLSKAYDRFALSLTEQAKDLALRDLRTSL